MTGTGSVFESLNCLVVGRTGATGYLNTSNQVEVADGGKLVVKANLTIGLGNNTTNCLMTVHGPGSLATVGNTLTLGNSNPSWNFLTVSNAATVRVATNLIVGANAGATTGNTVRVQSANLSVTNAAATGKLDIRRGTMIVEGASGNIVVDAMDMTAGSTACTLGFVADANGVTKVKVNGALTVSSSNKLTLDISALQTAGEYVLVEYGNMLTKFSVGNIAVTGNFRPYTLDQESGNRITLNLPLYGTTVLVK